MKRGWTAMSTRASIHRYSTPTSTREIPKKRKAAVPNTPPPRPYSRATSVLRSGSVRGRPKAARSRAATRWYWECTRNRTTVRMISSSPRCRNTGTDCRMSSISSRQGRPQLGIGEIQFLTVEAEVDRLQFLFRHRHPHIGFYADVMDEMPARGFVVGRRQREARAVPQGHHRLHRALAKGRLAHQHG